MTVFALMNRTPSSASTADDMTAWIICEMLRTAPLLKGMLSFPAMNVCPPTRLQDFDFDWISIMRCCGLPRPCCLRGRLVLHPPALPCSPRIVDIAP
jgi:hypothetical protein